MGTKKKELFDRLVDQLMDAEGLTEEVNRAQMCEIVRCLAETFYERWSLADIVEFTTWYGDREARG